VKLRIVLDGPVPGVSYGLQKGSGSEFEIEQSQQAKNGEDLRFEFEVRTEGGDCRGPYVQGRRGERFTYISVGAMAGQVGSPWSRRIKVPLPMLPDEQFLEARVPGRGRDGTPSCATQKPLSGWVRCEGEDL
jgi:hypothetical protein